MRAARAAIFAVRPAAAAGRRGPGRAGRGWGAQPGGRAGARLGALFFYFVRARPGAGWRRGGERRCEAGRWWPASGAGGGDPPSSPPPRSLLPPPSLPRSLFIAARHDASLPSAAAAAAALRCGRTRPRASGPSRGYPRHPAGPSAPGPAGGASPRTPIPEAGSRAASASSWGG